MPQLQSKYWWDVNFWERVEGTDSRWTAQCPFEDRLVFELEVEAMVRSCIPKQLHDLRQAYARCNWSDRPAYAICDLEDAVLAASYCEDHLETRDVLGQLKDVDHERDGVLIPAPQVKLSFPESDLATFLQGLKYHAVLTAWRFVNQWATFLHELPLVVAASLREQLFEIAVVMLMEKLKSPG